MTGLGSLRGFGNTPLLAIEPAPVSWLPKAHGGKEGRLPLRKQKSLPRKGQGWETEISILEADGHTGLPLADHAGVAAGLSRDIGVDQRGGTKDHIDAGAIEGAVA